jgi:hypothetical protein
MSILYLTTAEIFVPPPVINDFNGGVLQANIGTPGYSGDHVYLNVLKFFQGFYSPITGGVSPPPTMFTGDGYPNATFDYGTYGGSYGVGYIPTQAERAGQYKVTWDGTGTIYCPTRSSLTGSLSTSGFTFMPSSNRISIGISAGTNVTNLKCFHVNDEGRVTAGEKYNKTFLDRWAEGGYGRMRFMDWQSGNFGAMAQWKYRKQASHICYAYFDGRPDLFAGTTTNTGDAYTITSFNDPYYGTAAPVHGQTFLVKWNALATTEAPTLRINGHGPYLIRHQSGRTIFAGATASSRPGLNAIGTLIYDANFGAFLHYGQPGLNIYIDNGMPYEEMIDLCNITGSHPHFISPTATASDGPTDVYAQLAALCQSRGASWMKPAFETNNEIFTTAFNATQYSKEITNIRNQAGTVWTATNLTWNPAGPFNELGTATMTFSGVAPPAGTLFTAGTFSGTNGFTGQQMYVIAVNVGSNPLAVTVNRAPNGATGQPWTGTATVTAAAESGASLGWVGRIASLLGQQVSAAYSNNRSKYDMLVGVQTGLGLNGTASSAQRMDATAYVAQGGSPPNLWVTEGTCAQYINPGTYNTKAEMIGAYNYYMTGDVSYVAAYVDRLGDASGSSSPDGFTIPRGVIMWDNWRAYFKARGVMRLSGYEGGYSSNFIRPTDNVLTITSPVSGLTNAAQATITLASSSWPGGNVDPAPAIDNTCVGFMLAITGLSTGPTALNCTQGSCTFANGSATITRTNTFIAGQLANFTTDNTLPTGTGFAKNKPLYIVNPTGTTFQVSTTKGGSAIVFNTAGQLGTHLVQSGWRVLGVTGNVVTLDVDTSNTTTYPAWISGGLVTYVNARIMLNNLRADAKQCVASPGYPSSGMKGWSKQAFNAFMDNSGDPTFSRVFGSQYFFSATVDNLNGLGDHGDVSVWGGLNEGIYTTLPCPMHYACAEINAAAVAADAPRSKRKVSNG